MTDEELRVLNDAKAMRQQGATFESVRRRLRKAGLIRWSKTRQRWMLTADGERAMQQKCSGPGITIVFS